LFETSVSLLSLFMSISLNFNRQQFILFLSNLIVFISHVYFRLEPKCSAS
jgi:mannose/fructose/N-acetylgalactosamine-specific phosphotransferase system component IID